MIELVNGVYVATCDGCGTKVNTGLRSFHQAVNYISRAEGRANRRPRGVWSNYCPRCGDDADDLGIVGIGFTKKPADDDD